MKDHIVERRRGKALEDAVLDAAWGELLDSGYSSFTMEAVAARAHTSRPVLYRRWPRRADLAGRSDPTHAAETPCNCPQHRKCARRSDCFAAAVSKNRALFAVFFSLQMSEYFSETNTSPADLRKSVLQGGHCQIDVVLARGVDRGEIDRSKLTPRIASLLPDLVRHEFLMTLKPVPNAAITEFVDDIFLPLVRPKPARGEKK